MLEILVSIYLISLMIGRWTLPIKRKFSKHVIARMMLEYIANGADIAHMFSVVDEEQITISLDLTNTITGKLIKRFRKFSRFFYIYSDIILKVFLL